MDTWRVGKAQATGTSHLATEMPCQDRLAFTLLSDGSFVAALADGAGSAKRAEHGAEIAVRNVVTQLVRGLAEKRSDYERLLHEAAAYARLMIAAVAYSEDRSVRDYASTLLTLVLTPAGGGAMQIGDGVIVVSEALDEWSWVFWPQRGEYANTTRFLTDEDAMERLELTYLPRFASDVALTTDGLEPLALHYANRAVHGPFFQPILRRLLGASDPREVAEFSRELEAFISSDRVRSRTDDDMSLIVATRRQREPEE